MTRSSSISVIIPCRNEARTINEIVNCARVEIDNLGVAGEVIVVDNGSTDSSSILARTAGAKIVYEEMVGYGAALDAGIRAAKNDIIVFVDADLSYSPNQIRNIVRPIAMGTADVVLGSRLSGTIEKNAMPFLNRHFGTPILNYVIRFVCGLKTTDCNSGMRALRRDCYLDLKLKCKSMAYASEMLVRVAHCGFRYVEVPIVFMRDQRGGPSHLRRWRDGWQHLWILLQSI